MLGKLYIVPTPIGNLEDITLRALRILQEVDVVLAEDTRTSQKLWNKYEISTPIKPYHAHNEHKSTDYWITQLQDGKQIAQVSDAGTPGISDPGFLLIKQCIEKNIPIECLPGATAFVPALLLSGFANHEFVFMGFLPKKKGRQTKIQEIAEEKRTVIVYESPHKIIKTLMQLQEILPANCQLSISRELTKMFEETLRGTPQQLQEHFEKNPPKGEFVIVIEGNRIF